MISRLSSKTRYRNNSTLVRRFAPPSPSERGIDLKIVPLPLGEGGAKRRTRVEFHNNRGFTLIEVLVSLSIMALITGIAFSGLSAGIDSWERGTRRIQELDRRVSVERLLARQLPLATKGQ